jgi:hypothetical protein
MTHLSTLPQIENIQQRIFSHRLQLYPRSLFPKASTPSRHHCIPSKVEYFYDDELDVVPRTKAMLSNANHLHDETILESSKDSAWQ